MSAVDDVWEQGSGGDWRWDLGNRIGRPAVGVWSKHGWGWMNGLNSLI
jgi:hypothetical protein